ncbi:hypothetical protein AC579_1593 [Pseudocercospora musae]|uniref:Acid phosphatase n=1 Tax=Pseudocercospora musae TaxID=113226 RepID=A0A139HMI6_9PEZI|nr:hypothetical protein AC579_1593 [Pseudocercospora musae]
MASTLAILSLAVSRAVAQASYSQRGDLEQLQPDLYTATDAAHVYAAQATAPTYAGQPKYVPGKAFDRFIEIWLENTDYDKAAGDPKRASLCQITLVSRIHRNLIMLLPWEGTTLVWTMMTSVLASNVIEDKGISWGTYQEDMPFTGFEGFAWKNQKTGANDYVRKHNPPVIYNANTSPRRLSYQKNTTVFHEDVKAHRLPQWSFITPNMTSDGHDTTVTVAGTWCRDFLEPLLNHSYFMDRTLVLLTFDENHTYNIGNRVFSILLGNAVPENLHGTTDKQFYNHYSDIATVEANWNLHTLGRWDVGANVFKLVADHTGDVYRPWDAVTGVNETVFLNSSFAGPFKTAFESAPYPILNVNAVSPKPGRTVLPSIQKAYSASRASTYYNHGVEIPDGQHPPKGYAVNIADN